MPVKTIDSFQEFQTIINSGKVVVIDFWATWCGPCRVISPIFEELSTKNDKVEFYKVDVDAQPDIAQELGVRAMPTFVALKDGNKLDTFVGANPPGLTNLIQKVATA